MSDFLSVFALDFWGCLGLSEGLSTDSESGPVE